jgi:hypothetical protein
MNNTTQLDAKEITRIDALPYGHNHAKVFLEDEWKLSKSSHDYKKIKIDELDVLYVSSNRSTDEDGVTASITSIRLFNTSKDGRETTEFTFLGYNRMLISLILGTDITNLAEIKKMILVSDLSDEDKKTLTITKAPHYSYIDLTNLID